MNFGVIEIDRDTQEFWADVCAFFEEHVTEQVLDDEREHGSGFCEALHLAMGRRGWVTPQWPADEGGAELDALRARIIAEEFTVSGAPDILTSVQQLPPIAIRMFGNEEMKAQVLPRVADGTARICLGYTEPDCGSDLAAVRTRAVRDGSDWVITGQKMFTTGAQHSQYCFLLTRSDPDAAKHKGLTVFLLPLDSPGVQVRPIQTLGGERTNFIYLDEVRLDDRWRIGEVNDGWRVISAPLQQEQGIGDENAENVGFRYLVECQKIIDAAASWASQTPAVAGNGMQISDPVWQERLAEFVVGMELARSTPGPMGRIVASEFLIRTSSQILDLIGPLAVLAHGADGAPCDGVLEAGYRFAPATAIYGGSTEVARNVIAEHVLGLPRSTPRRSTA